jgi:hypothetical protein
MIEKICLICWHLGGTCIPAGHPWLYANAKELGPKSNIMAEYIYHIH